MTRWILALAALSFAACRRESPASVTAPTRASHAVYFDIERGSHRSADCAECHGAFDTFARFDCLGCHDAARTDPKHASVPGYQHASAACYGCHASGESIDPQAHAAFFPIAAGTPHAGAACASCHLDPSSREVIGCTSCHAHAPATMTAAHAGVGGYSAGGDACIACHAEAQVDRLADHLPFVITAGAHLGRSCLACHPATRTDKPWAVSFAAVDCLGCHEQPETGRQHAGRAEYAWTTAACLGCHPSGRD